MPIYEYECGQCDTTFERRQGFHDEPVGTCPTCGDTVRRVYHPVGIIFKGPGFYITDSRPRAKEEGASATSSASSASTSSGDSASETPAAKAGSAS